MADLYRGPLLDGFFLDSAPEFVEWLERERARLAADRDRAGLLLTRFLLSSPARAGLLHGDPHPWNLVNRRGRLAGLIDYGDVCAGDPASDLATGWLTLDPSQRAVFRGVLDAGGTHDDDAWRRARAWAGVWGEPRAAYRRAADRRLGRV